MSKIHKPDFVIFDFDGVLADTDHAWFTVVAEELAAEGVETTADALLAGHRGKVIDASARDFERDYSIVLPVDWIDRVVRRALVEVGHGFVPIPGAVAAVRSVADAALPLAVASGSLRQALTSGIRRLEIGEVVKDRYFSSHDDGKQKPLPDVYLRACAGLGLPPERGVAVEDSRSGVASAHAAGMTVIGFAPHTDADGLLDVGAAVVIETMADLPSVISI
jgi:beta-phosphoglucomutase-like phosphatase (HAD superfamily)